VQRLVADLNRLYTSQPALHRFEFEPGGFEWIEANDGSHSVFSFLRTSGEDQLLVVLNFTPVPRHNWRVGVPAAGEYREVLNSDSHHYGGTNVGNVGSVRSQPVAANGRAVSVEVSLPPLGVLILERLK
jgi:1,4-alpha-glucan branching enzyme